MGRGGVGTRFGKGIAHRVKAARGKPGSTWHLDEMFVKLRGERYLLWRAADEHGAELDVLLQKRCDKAAAKCFLKRVLRSNPVPRKIITDQLRNYSAAKAEIPELRGVKHVFVNAAAQLRCAETRGRPPIRRLQIGVRQSSEIAIARTARPAQAPPPA
jgi:putative transposase